MPRQTMFVCKDGTVSYAPEGSPSFNRVALPVHTVESVAEATMVQVTLCRKQYIAHPQMPGRPWYVLTHFGGNVEELDRVTALMQQVSKRFNDFNQRKPKPEVTKK